jgi:hypothetical protein
MTIELMGNRRHAELIKAAEETIDGIGDGLAPNAALMKSAKEHDLNSKEVALVSSTVNNALTVSHLADSEPEQKADPFVITNADEVSQQLFPEEKGEKPQNGIEPGKKPTDDDVESPLELDPQAQAKKASEMRMIGTPKAPSNLAEDAYLDYGDYHDADVDGSGHVKTAREAFALEGDPNRAGRMKVAADLSHGVSTDGEGRLTQDPYIHLRNLKVACDEARTRYDAARTEAYCQLEKIAEDFRRTDAPSFAKVAALAKRAGVTPATINVIFTAGQLDRFGHTNQQIKLASHGVVVCTHHEMGYVEKVSQLETMWKQAAHCLAAKDEVERRTTEAEAQIHKIAQINAGEYAAKAEQTLGEFPSLATGAGSEDMYDMIGDAAGTSTDKDVEYDELPLPNAARQRLENVSAQGSFSSMLDDDYIASRPMPEIVKAYNAAIQATRGKLPPEQLKAAVKRQLAGGEDLDLETMSSLEKSTKDQ